MRCNKSLLSIDLRCTLLRNLPSRSPKGVFS